MPARRTSRSTSSPRCPALRARPGQSCPEFLFQSRRDCIPASGQRPDHNAIRRRKVVKDRPGHMPQPACDLMPLHRVPHGFRDDESDARTFVGCGVTQCVQDKIGLRSSHPLTDRGTELGGPSHPVPRRKHRARSCVESRSQLAATLGTPTRHDGPAGPGPHPQSEAVHARATPVVRLKCPLALGHGCSPRFRLAPTTHRNTVSPVGRGCPLVSSSVLLSRRGPHQIWVAAVPPRSGDCSRVLTRFP